MTLEGGEMDVGDEKNRLRLEVRHRLEDGDVAALVQKGNLDIWANWGKQDKDRVKTSLTGAQVTRLYYEAPSRQLKFTQNNKQTKKLCVQFPKGVLSVHLPLLRDCFLSSSRILRSAPLSQKTLIWQ